MPPKSSSSTSPPSAPTASGSGHARRASTHSIGVSYAYGAPSSTGKSRSPARGSPKTKGANGNGIDDGSSMISGGTNQLEDGEAEDAPSEAGTQASNYSASGIGRALEPAAVRYARLQQRKKDTGSPFLPPPPPPPVAQNNNFSHKKQAAPKPPGGGVKDTSVNIASAFAQAVSSSSGPRGAMLNLRKEPVRYPLVAEDEDDDEDSGKETQRPGPAAGEGSSRKRKKRTSKDLTFKHRVGETDSDDEEISEGGRSKSNSKKARTGAEEDEGDEEEDEAREEENTNGRSTSKLPAARRRSENASYRPTEASELSSEEESDPSTQRRRSKGKGKATAGAAANAIPIGRRDSEVWYGKKRKGRRGSRKSGSGASGEDDPEGEGDGDAEQDLGGYEHQPEAPNPASFFLRQKSPEASRAFQGHALSSSGGRAPFQPDIDPSFNFFDRSINTSADDSGVRGSSYDYSEEERIVAALEKQKQSNGLRKRTNRLPGPPVQPHILDGIEEEEEGEARGKIGNLIGSALKPVWASTAKAWKAMQNPHLHWTNIWKAIGLASLFLLLLTVYLTTSSTSTPLPVHRTSFTDFIPFYPRRTSSYVAPDLPPGSLDQLIERLTVLEQATTQLSAISDSERQRADSERKATSKIGERVLDLEASLAHEKKRATKALEQSEAIASKEAEELGSDLKAAKADLEALVTRVKLLSDGRVADEKALRHLESSMQSVGQEIASLGTKVAQVAKDVEAGLKADRISQIALEAIEARLPSKLAVRVDSNGKVEIDPAFWRHLRDAFVERKDIDRLVESKVSTELSRAPSAGSRGSAPAAPVAKQPTWDDFLHSNEAALRSWINSDIASRTGSDVLVSKKTFLDTLHREIKNLKIDFEAKSNENVEKIGQELLSKVAKQEHMRKEGALGHLNPFHKSSSHGSGQPVVSKTSDGQDLSAIIGSLVDSALLRYSKDALARPDYALYTSGGRVIPTLTSPTYEARPIGVGPKLLAWISGGGAIPGRPPVTALHPDNHLGSCWPFAGKEGSLGILLSRRVIPSDITIEHASIDVALDGDVRSAPRDFEVWGVVEGREDITRLGEHRKQQLLQRQRSAQEGAEPGFEEEGEISSSLPPTPNHILLATGSYDITSPTPTQTFPVTSSARQLGIPVGVVVFKILSNHGDPHYTCLYRVRVHGQSEAMTAEAQANANVD